ncbi:ThiF family protein [Diaporthe helianthi]|uniref:Ubiquitin-like 1-activating enzyme E1A n=1 Tax=Diaporthe helianthi TaxID=158607 RepID=A0A2P5I6V7_DIAHE|nr:ThiF family protein [Diaporthe helianthi]
MDQPAQTAPGQEDGTSTHTNAQPEGYHATQTQTAPDANANPMQHGNFSNLPMQPGMPTDLNLLSLLPQDGSLLGPEALMNMPNMPMMMPIMMHDGSMDANGMLSMPQNGISNDEIALYDRQIRLWGIAAQQKIRNANVLLITMKGLANEIAKNLVLAGIGSLTIVDHENVSEADLGAQFFLSEKEGHLGKNRAEAALPQVQKLNPRVTVIADTDDVRFKGASYFALFDMVIATDLAPDALNIINTATRLNMRPFYAAGTHGLYGFIFADLIEHTFSIEREKPNVPTELKAETRTRNIFAVDTKKENGKVMEIVSKKELYSTWLLASDGAFLPEEYTKSKRRLKAVSPALSCLRALWEFQTSHDGRHPGANQADLAAFTKSATQKHKDLQLPGETLTAEFLRSFLQNIGCEVAPVTAILGGQLAQDVINVLGQTQQPIQNMVIFDGNTMEASLYPLHPEGALGASLLSMGMGHMAGIHGMGNGDMNGLMGDPSMMSMGMPMMDNNFNHAAMGGTGVHPQFNTGAGPGETQMNFTGAGPGAGLSTGPPAGSGPGESRTSV